MCVSFGPADFSNTIIFADKLKNGQHVLGYQNTAENLSSNKVNAMLLPLPAANKLGPGSMIDTTSCKDIFKDMQDAIPRRRTRGFGPAVIGCAAGSLGFQIFKSGVYTVLLASNASYIKFAINKLPEEERPVVANDILEAYQVWYPGWQMALCLWSGKDALEANPILWKFDPIYPERLFYPGLDAHDGMRPNLNKNNNVSRSHSLIVGSELELSGIVKYSNTLTPELEEILPKKVCGELSVPSGKIIFLDI